MATLTANGDLAALLERVRGRGSTARPSSATLPSVAELLAREACLHGTPGGVGACALCRRSVAPAAPISVVPAEEARAAARAAFTARERASPA